jgi:mediator of RNA polymerase II transcription subunit 4
LEDSWHTIIAQLEEGRRNLEAVITEGDARLNAIEQANDGMSMLYSSGLNVTKACFFFFAATIPYPELLAYTQSECVYFSPT